MKITYPLEKITLITDGLDITKNGRIKLTTIYGDNEEKYIERAGEELSIEHKPSWDEWHQEDLEEYLPVVLLKIENGTELWVITKFNMYERMTELANCRLFILHKVFIQEPTFLI